MVRWSIRAGLNPRVLASTRRSTLFLSVGTDVEALRGGFHSDALSAALSVFFLNTVNTPLSKRSKRVTPSAVRLRQAAGTEPVAPS